MRSRKFKTAQMQTKVRSADWNKRTEGSVRGQDEQTVKETKLIEYLIPSSSKDLSAFSVPGAVLGARGTRDDPALVELTSAWEWGCLGAS